VKLSLLTVKTTSLAALLLLAGLSSTAGALGQSGANNAPAAAAAVSDANLENIRTMVRRAIAEQNVPGYAIAIIKDGKVVFTETLGFADLQAQKPVDGNTVFGLASVTKTFTGLAILHLIDEGKIRPNDSLDKYLKNLPAAWQKLTIFQLATMSAGLPESRAGELPWPEEMPYLEGQALAYQPDTKHIYSNPSFRVLGSVIEAVTGKTYMEYIKGLILEPLQMDDTGTTSSLEGSGRVSQQYVGPPGGAVHSIKPKNPMTSYSAGMLASSLNDMCKYAIALLDKKILTEAGYRAYFFERPPLPTGTALNWAYGWGSTENAKLKQHVIAMNGGLPGVSSTVILLPKSNVAVVALANLRRKPVPQVARRAMRMYFGVDDADEANGGEPETGSEPENKAEKPGEAAP
jgi:CubicO group peptidase (beta-lactamase class C family)